MHNRMMQAARPGETEDPKPDADAQLPPNIPQGARSTPQGAQNIPAQPPAPGAQLPPNIPQGARSTPQGAQNIPAQPPVPGTQQPSGMSCTMPDGRVVYQQRLARPAMTQPMTVQGQFPGQIVHLPTAQPQHMWPSMQMPYTAPTPHPAGPVVVPPTGVDLRPPSYLIMTLTVTFICFILNAATLIFGVPAIVLSVLCEERKKNAQYGLAKTYGKIALGINIANIVYTAAVAIVILASVLGAVRSSYSSY